MRQFLFLIAFFFASEAYAQKHNTLPPPSGKPMLTLFIDYSIKSSELSNAFNTEPDLQAIKSNVTFYEMSSISPMYQQKWEQIIPRNRLPAVMLQDPRDGGVVYMASGENVPTFDTLDDQIVMMWDAYTAAKQLAEPVMQQQSESRGPQPDCPDGNCPPNWNQQPQERILIPTILDTLSKRPTPIRDTISGAIWLLVLAVVAVFLMLIAFAVLAFIIVVAVNRRTPPE